MLVGSLNDMPRGRIGTRDADRLLPSLLHAIVVTQGIPLLFGDTPAGQRIGTQHLQASALRLGIEIKEELDDDRTIVRQRPLKGPDPIETALERVLATDPRDSVVNGGTVPGVEKKADPATRRQRPPVTPEARALSLFVRRQLRPWESSGFFVKGGMGMAFVRNWLFAGAPITQKALALAIGTGWEFRRSERIGFQVYGAQHAAALGDFELRDETLENVMGNYWSVGAALVIR